MSREELQKAGSGEDWGGGAGGGREAAETSQRHVSRSEVSARESLKGPPPLFVMVFKGLMLCFRWDRRLTLRGGSPRMGGEVM